MSMPAPYFSPETASIRRRVLGTAAWVLAGGAVILAADFLARLAVAQQVGTEFNWLNRAVEASAEHFGGLFIASVAGALAYMELRAHRRAQEKNFELEEKRFAAEEAEREKLAIFRAQEYARFAKPSEEIARHIAGELVKHPDWARGALEAAKLLPYTYTLFGERSQHFREEKHELSERFIPYLLKRCEALTSDGRHVFLLIDAGTTLYAFFDILGTETQRRAQRGEEWLPRFHLVTNNLPGIEQLIKSGRRDPWDRYSRLAIEHCHLLPGIPVPIFAAVAGEETNDAILRLRARYPRSGGTPQVTFIALVVGNWIRIRRSAPHCPIPMARGEDHRRVKQTLFDTADEVFVVSPLGKIFVDRSNREINDALGFSQPSRDPERTPYEDVEVDNDLAKRTKLVSTRRAQGRLLHRHSNRVEDKLLGQARSELPEDEEFATRPVDEVPHLLFPFSTLPTEKAEEFAVEFPHYHTRANRTLLEMFDVDQTHI